MGAVRLTAKPVVGNGGVYQYVDLSVTQGQSYWYWLEDASDGQRYGPQAVAVPRMDRQIYLPTIGR